MTILCASGFTEASADHAHQCALYVDAGPHEGCNHLCGVDGCGIQWSDLTPAVPHSPNYRAVLVEQPGVTQ